MQGRSSRTHPAWKRRLHGFPQAGDGCRTPGREDDRRHPASGPAPVVTLPPRARFPTLTFSTVFDTHGARGLRRYRPAARHPGTEAKRPTAHANMRWKKPQARRTVVLRPLDPQRDWAEYRGGTSTRELPGDLWAGPAVCSHVRIPGGRWSGCAVEERPERAVAAGARRTTRRHGALIQAPVASSRRGEPRSGIWPAGACEAPSRPPRAWPAPARGAQGGGRHAARHAPNRTLQASALR